MLYMLFSVQASVQERLYANDTNYYNDVDRWQDFGCIRSLTLLQLTKSNKNDDTWNLQGRNPVSSSTPAAMNISTKLQCSFPGMIVLLSVHTRVPVTFDPLLFLRMNSKNNKSKRNWHLYLLISTQYPATRQVFSHIYINTYYKSKKIVENERLNVTLEYILNI